MSADTIHLVRCWDRGTIVLWCGLNGHTVEQFVTEAFFADCAVCSTARARAASAVKPKAEPPAVIVLPYPENPHG